MLKTTLCFIIIYLKLLKVASGELAVKDLCVDLFTEAFNQPSDINLPFLIESSQDLDYVMNKQIIKLNILNHPNHPGLTLNSFLIKVESIYSNKEEIIGSFESTFDKSVEFQKCFEDIYNSKNLAYRNNNFSTLPVSLTWTGPIANGLQFRMTLIQDSNVYWLNVIHKINLIKNAPLFSEISTYEQVSINKNDGNLIDNLGCGISKGCLFSPSHKRNIEDLLGFVSYKKIKHYIKFEVSVLLKNVNKAEYGVLKFLDLDEHKANKAQKYGSLAVKCGFNSKNEAIYQLGYYSYYSSKQFNRIPIILKNYLKNPIVYKTTNNGKTYLNCIFYLKVNISSVYNGDVFNVNFNQVNFRLALSKGGFYKETNVLIQETPIPYVSDKRVNISKNSIHTGSTFNLSLKLHVIFELIAWMMFSQMALTLNSQFNYGIFAEDHISCTNVPCYFLWYRLLTFFVFFTSAGGLVLIFSHYDDFLLSIQNLHCLFGILALALNLVQCVFIIANKFEKNKTESCVYSLSSKIGWISAVVAILSMFYGINLPQINDYFHQYFLIILIVYTAVEVLKLVVLELTYKSRKNYVLFKHDKTRVVRNSNSVAYLLLYLSCLELLVCISAYCYFVFLY